MDDNERNLRDKVSRGKFTAGFYASMPESFRNGVFALGLIGGIGSALIALAWFSGLHRPIGQGERSNAPGQQVDAMGGSGEVPSIVAGQPQTPDSPGHPDYYSEQDLRAQESMAESTKAIVNLTAVSILLGTIGSGFLLWTLLETRRTVEAANEANRIMRAEARPWVSIEQNVLCDFIYEEGSDRCFLYWECTLTNKGKMPAHDISVVCDVYRYDWSFIGAGTQGVEDVVRQAEKRVSQYLPVIFPSESRPRTTYGRYRIKGEEKGTIFLCACVIYSLDPLSDERGLHAQAFLPQNKTNRLGPLAFNLLRINLSAYTRIE